MINLYPSARGRVSAGAGRPSRPRPGDPSGDAPRRGGTDIDGRAGLSDLNCIVAFILSDIPRPSQEGANAHEDEQIDVHDLQWIIRAVIR